MRKILLTGMMGLLLLLGLMVVLPGLLNLNHYKDEISGKVKAYTGRTLTIKGDIRLSFLPTLTLKAENITLSNPSGFTSADMVSIPELQVSVKLLPLLSGTLVVEDINLKNPVFFLEKDAKGKPNWQFAFVSQTADKAGKKSAVSHGDSSLLSRFYFKNIVINDATIRYKEGMSSMVFNDVSTHVFFNKMSGKTEVTLSFNHDGQSITSAGEIADMFALLEGKTTACKVSATYGERHLALTASDASIVNKTVLLNNAMLEVDKIVAKGNIEVNFAGPLPKIRAVLESNQLDVRPYMASSPAPKVEKSHAVSSSNESHWGDTPFNLAFLKKLEANIQFHADSIVLPSLVINKSDISAIISAGKLHLYGKNMVLYDGDADMMLTLDSISSPSLLWNADISLAHVNAGRFLREIASFKQLSGIADSKLTLSSQGRTAKEIVSALKGQGKVMLSKGALRGINLSLPPEKITALLAGGAGKEEETPFDSATASFTVEKGIVSNNDLLLHTPLTDINGKGTIDLPNYLIHYRLLPSQASKFLGDRKIAVAIEGRLNDPKITVDVSQLIPQNHEDVKETINAIKGLKKNKTIKEEINRLRDILKNVQ